MLDGMAGAALAVAVLATGGAGAASAPATKAAVDAGFQSLYPHLDALYKDIHSHPEIAFQEHRTAAILAAEMRKLGFEVTEGVGQTGVVAVFKNGPGPVVLVRTELDALPMEEKTGLAYASHVKTVSGGKETFVDHACGHDIHMAAWVGTASELVALKDRWRGTLVFIGQPAEEAIGGAAAMLKDGLLTRFPRPTFGFALHVNNGPAGDIFYKPGVLTSNADSFTILFHGRGAHGSAPNLSVDPVVMAARFIEDVQTVVSREKDPAQFGVVTVGGVQAGTVGNIIPDQAVLVGTIRSYDKGVRVKLKAGVERVARAVSLMSDAPPPEVSFPEGAQAVVNDPALTARTGEAFKAAFGPRAVELSQPITASEDYSDFIEAGVPSTFFNIGGYIARTGPDGGPLPGNHSPYFAPAPEPAIRTGVEAMTLAVVNVLGR